MISPIRKILLTRLNFESRRQLLSYDTYYTQHYYIPVTLQNQLCAINQAANILARAYCKKRTSSFANWNDDGNAAAIRMIMIRLATLIERPPPLCTFNGCP